MNETAVFVANHSASDGRGLCGVTLTLQRAILDDIYPSYMSLSKCSPLMHPVP